MPNQEANISFKYFVLSSIALPQIKQLDDLPIEGKCRKNRHHIKRPSIHCNQNLSDDSRVQKHGKIPHSLDTKVSSMSYGTTSGSPSPTTMACRCRATVSTFKSRCLIAVTLASILLFVHLGYDYHTT